MSFFALVPARGGSKGLPGKNLMEVQGISLVARAILVAGEVPDISRIILSTDDDDIMEEGKRAGAEVPFKRPANLSRSDTPMVKVLEHAVDWIRNDIGHRDCLSGLVVLQPTSPMRKPEHITGAINLFMEERLHRAISGVITVSPVPEDSIPDRLIKLQDEHPVMSENGKKRYVIAAGLKAKKKPYYRNGAAVILDPDHIGALNSFDPPVIPYIIREQLISIDSFTDLMKAEYCDRRLFPDPIEINWISHSEKMK